MTDRTDLTDRVAFVTGAARGQGRAYAYALAEAGASVVTVDLPDTPASDDGLRDVIPYPLGAEADLAETAAGVKARGADVHQVTADVRDADAVDAAVASAVERFGHLDIVITTAGVSLPVGVPDCTAAQWRAVLDTNLTGTFHTIQACSPHLIARGWGRIITIASVMGRMGNPMSAAYAASKWGVIGLTKSVALDLVGHGITANAIAPGNVATPMIFNDMMYRLFRPDLEAPTAEDAKAGYASLNPQQVPWVEPEELARMMLFLVDERSSHITGAVFGLDNGISASFT